MNARPLRCGNGAAFGGAQRGAALFIALVVLLAMMLAGVALVRAVDIDNLIAGNIAFRQSALQAADVGLEAGYQALIARANTDDTDTATNYYANYDPQASQAPEARLTAAAGQTALALTNNTAGNTVVYVIERLCRADGPITADNCLTPPDDGGSRAQHHTSFAAGNGYYRITARSQGPRDTLSFAQIIVRL